MFRIVPTFPTSAMNRYALTVVSMNAIAVDRPGVGSSGPPTDRSIAMITL